MTAKRFKHSEIIQDDGQTICYGIEDTQTRHIFNVIGEGIYDVSEKELIKLLNELHEENEQLKQQLSEAKADEEQLGISFMGYKMKLIEVLQKKYDKVKGKTLYADVYTEIAEEMGVDLE